MKLSNTEKREFLISFISNNFNQDEKSIIESIKASVKSGSAVDKLMTDLLTNDFNCENHGYFYSNLIDTDNMIYTGVQINALYNAVVNMQELQELEKLSNESFETHQKITKRIMLKNTNWLTVENIYNKITVKSGHNFGRYIIIKLNGFLFMIKDGAHNIYDIEVLDRVKTLPTIKAELKEKRSDIKDHRVIDVIDSLLKSVKMDLSEMKQGVTSDHVRYLCKQIDARLILIQLAMMGY